MLYDAGMFLDFLIFDRTGDDFPAAGFCSAYIFPHDFVVGYEYAAGSEVVAQVAQMDQQGEHIIHVVEGSHVIGEIACVDFSRFLGHKADYCFPQTRVI